MSPLAPVRGVSPLIDDSIRGAPVGVAPLAATEIAAKRLRPADGAMSLPVVTLDEATFVANRDLMLRYIAEHGVLIAPHAKTAMSPDLARSQFDAGAWGATVADARQAAVMARAGIDRLLLANEVGGAASARRLAAFVTQHPAIELYVFADSVPAVEALAAGWRDNPDAPPLRVLVEVGAARAGARTLAEAVAAAEAIVAARGRLVLAGVATYEGAVVRETPQETQAAIDGLLTLTAAAFAETRRRADRDARLIVTAGGSLYFDRVVAALKPAVDGDGRAALVLRASTIFFGDHGFYDGALAALDERGGFTLDGKVASARSAFRPALRLWAEVLSRPEPALAICGLGLHDASFDRGFPVPLRVHRDGRPLPRRPASRVIKLNDQHAFVALAKEDDFAVGDIVEFGFSHPSTCLDLYRFLFGLDEEVFVRHAFPTEFG